MVLMATPTDYWQSRYEQAAAEIDRLRSHSELANRMGWRILEALGRVTGELERATGNPLLDLETLIEERDAWRATAKGMKA